jgi:NTE family protein
MPGHGPTAFVLAGGGSLGAVEVGMLKALTAHGLTADLVVGASVGAINAAYYAGRPTIAGVAALDAIWRKLETKDVFPFSPVKGFLGFVGWQDAFVDPGPLERLLRHAVPFQRIEDATLPCHIVATDVLDGGEVVLSRGPVLPALLASAAIPGVFPPVVHDGKTLFDGGVASNTPIATAIEKGAQRVIVLPTGYSCALKTPPHGALALAIHALTLMIVHQLVTDPYAAIDDLGLADRADHVRRLFERVDDAHEALVSSLPRQIVHGDFAFPNLLVDYGHVTGLVDFEFAGADFPA